ncbi:MAG: hypothetical protein O7G32_04545, partial [SAR324 cluster bacterium]|nr:hypothetical protein [SAR324 cluster bacterium]
PPPPPPPPAPRPELPKPPPPPAKLPYQQARAALSASRIAEGDAAPQKMAAMQAEPQQDIRDMRVSRRDIPTAGTARPGEAQRVTPVRIAVLSSVGRMNAGQQVAMILRSYQRQRLEKALGRPVKVAFVSSSNKKHKKKTRIRYRPGFLKAAIQVASAIPREQVVEPMSGEELNRRGVDVIIYLGSGVR